MKDFTSKNVKKIAGYLEAGCKDDFCENVGIECEHLIVDSENNAVSYYGENGVEEILKSLKTVYPHTVYSGGHLVGLDNGTVYISLEPGAQVESSIRASDDIDVLKKEYANFIFNLKSVTDKLGYKILNCGYQPRTKAKDIKIIPKTRYEMMDRYFSLKGTKALHMMRASASVQLSVDFYDEDDFARKYRVAYAIIPLLYLITDNTEYFEGEEYGGFSARSLMWKNVDDGRCRIPDIPFGEISFASYAEWIYSREPIFVFKNGREEYCGNKTAKEIYSGKEMTQDEISHLLSMVFPDARVKQFLEIRPADSMPKEYLLAYAALIKGIFYNDSALIILENLFDFMTAQDVETGLENIRREGFDAEYYNFTVKDVVSLMFELSESGLSKREIKILEPLKTSALNSKTIREAVNTEVIV